MAKDKKVKFYTEPQGSSGSPLKRLIVSILILCVVLYVAAYLGIRTEGFRTLVEGRIEKNTGLSVHIKQVRPTLGLDLVLKDVVTEGFRKKGKAGFTVEELVVRWSVKDLIFSGQSFWRMLEFKGLNLSFAPGENGTWEPAIVERLGSWLAEWGGFNIRPPEAKKKGGKSETEEEEESQPVSVEPRENLWERTGVKIANGNAVWWNDEGAEMASIEGIQLQVTPISVPNRDMTHFYLTIEKGGVEGGRHVKNFTFEMLKAGSQSIIMTCAEDRGIRKSKAEPASAATNAPARSSDVTEPENEVDTTPPEPGADQKKNEESQPEDP